MDQEHTNVQIFLNHIDGRNVPCNHYTAGRQDYTVDAEKNKIYCSLEKRPLITLYHGYCKLGKTIEVMHCFIQHV